MKYNIEQSTSRRFRNAIIFWSFISVHFLVPTSSSVAQEEGGGVARMDDRIKKTVREQGEIQSASRVLVRSKVPGTNSIISLVPEGTRVKKGDFLFRLDHLRLELSVREQQANVVKAESDQLVARKRVEKVEQASFDLKELLDLQSKKEQAERELLLGDEGELAHEKQVILGKISLSQQRCEYLANQMEIAKIEGDAATSLPELKMELVEEEIHLTNHKRALDLLEKKKRPSLSLELAMKHAEKRFELNRELTELTQKLAEYQSDVQVATQRLTELRKNLEQTERHLKNCVVVSPADGSVVYTVERSRTGNDWYPEEGATVRERQIVMSLTDFKQLQVKAMVSESRIARVRVGQAVVVRPDALPDANIPGRVSSVSRFPEAEGWMSTDRGKRYAVEIELIDPPRSLRIGMNALVEIFVGYPAQMKPQNREARPGEADPEKGEPAKEEPPEDGRRPRDENNRTSVKNLVKQILDRYDKNQDKVIDAKELAEADDRLKSTLEKADADGDGLVTEAELTR